MYLYIYIHTDYIGYHRQNYLILATSGKESTQQSWPAIFTSMYTSTSIGSSVYKFSVLNKDLYHVHDTDPGKAIIKKKMINQ